MKSTALHVVLLMVLMLFMASCNRNTGQEGETELPAGLVNNPGSSSGQGNTQVARIRFVRYEHDFGTVKEGEKVFWNFRFTNEGKADLILNRVKADCGCTVPEYPRTPIAPGQEGKIKVTFDTKGRSGMQIKKITVLSNSERPTDVLSIKALIEK